MPADPKTLYGIARPHRDPEHKLSSASSSAFTTQLTSLLSSSRNSKPNLTASGRSRSNLDAKLPKADIFTAHRAKKRPADQISRDENGQAHQTQEYIGGVDEEILKRSRRKMEEKAKVYERMKRGDWKEERRGYGIDEDRGPLVDFDRKWAERDHTNGSSDSDSEDEGGEYGKELVEYKDEFGRTRKGTKAEAEREARRRRTQAYATEELESMAARPKMPANIIHGDTIQYGAFNPDAAIERQMEELAARRDRSQTPPEDTHYDATKESRSKGVGFYQFSRDNEARKQEMENLEKDREQTEKWEEERRKNARKKEEEVDEMKRRQRELQNERDTNAFLRSLGDGGLSAFVVSGSQEQQSKKKKKGWGK